MEIDPHRSTRFSARQIQELCSQLEQPDDPNRQVDVEMEHDALRRTKWAFEVSITWIYPPPTHPVTIITRILTFFVGDLLKASFATIASWVFFVGPINHCEAEEKLEVRPMWKTNPIFQGLVIHFPLLFQEWKVVEIGSHPGSKSLESNRWNHPKELPLLDQIFKPGAGLVFLKSGENYYWSTRWAPSRSL